MSAPRSKQPAGGSSTKRTARAPQSGQAKRQQKARPSNAARVQNANRSTQSSRSASGSSAQRKRPAAARTTQQARPASRPRNGQPVKRRKKRNRRPGLSAWIISLIALIAGGYLIFEIIKIDVLPFFLLLLILIVIIVLLLGMIYVWLIRTRRPVSKIIAGTIVVALGIVFGVGGWYVRDTETMFNEITNLTAKKANIVNTYAMKVTGLTEPSNMTKGAKVGAMTKLDPVGSKAAIEQLREKGAEFEVVEYEDPFTMVSDLYKLGVDAIVFPENYHDQIYEVANDENQYNALTVYTNQLDEYVYYTDRDPSTINKADPVGNIMRDTFAILVSGNDSYGSIESSARSDVNMLVVINPKTAQILMISIPRDSYIPISCKKNTTACAEYAGDRDKLTHTGIFGVGTTESTIEDLLDTTINYYVRVNFSSLINLVDAVGGIDVNVPEGQEVETFYANGEEGVHAGMNHLDGSRALAFARERHAYGDGDNQRVQNQATVMRALIQKCASPAMFVNYPKVVKAVSTAIDTNMPARQLKSLVTLEIAKRPHWNIQNYAISGDPANEYCPILQSNASVTVPRPSMVQYAKNLIKEARDGKTFTVDPNGAAQFSDLDSEMFDDLGSSSQEDIDPYTGLPVELTKEPQYDAYGNPIIDTDDQNGYGW